VAGRWVESHRLVSGSTGSTVTTSAPIRDERSKIVLSYDYMSSVNVGSIALCDFVARMLEQLHVPGDDARLVADSLVWADLRGMPSHGVMRMPTYVGRIQSGEVEPRPDLTVDRRRSALAVVHGGRATGQVAFDRAATVAVEMARDAGISWVAIVESAHAGAIGYFSQRIAREGMAAIVVAASRPTMAYYGARSAGVSTSPIAMAVPASDGRVLGVDMATAAVSRGRIKLHRLTGEALAEGWAVDQHGRPTVDPERASIPQPLGGSKGSGMSLLFECLANVMGGSPVIQPSLTGTLNRHVQGGFVCAIDIEAFRDLGAFTGDVGALADAIKSLPPAEGVDEVLLPGERGDRRAREQQRSGVLLREATWAELTELAHELNVRVPASKEVT
jgi:ureidoglycolate dehydrogenase (NAD+)